MRFACLFFLLVSSVVLGQSRATKADLAEPTKGLESKVDAYVQPLVDGHNFTGCVLLARDGAALLERCYGMANYELQTPNTPRTRFHIASVSKSFTAAAILLLEQQGKLGVADKLAKFIADYP